MKAAEIIGISDRQMRCWRERYEEFGFRGLFDKILLQAATHLLIKIASLLSGPMPSELTTTTSSRESRRVRPKEFKRLFVIRRSSCGAQVKDSGHFGLSGYALAITCLSALSGLFCNLHWLSKIMVGQLPAEKAGQLGMPL